MVPQQTATLGEGVTVKWCYNKLPLWWRGWQSNSATIATLLLILDFSRPIFGRPDIPLFNCGRPIRGNPNMQNCNSALMNNDRKHVFM